MMNFVTLSEAQALVVMRLLDRVVRDNGLEAAAVALPIAEEIETQLNPGKDQTDGEAK